MEAVRLENNMLKLPETVAKRLRGKRIEIAEVQEGILLKTSADPILEARGFLGEAFHDAEILGDEEV